MFGLFFEFHSLLMKRDVIECVGGAVFVSAVDSITDVYTVNQLKLKAINSPEPFFGITYSFISKLALDSSVSKVIRTRW